MRYMHIYVQDLRKQTLPCGFHTFYLRYVMKAKKKKKGDRTWNNELAISSLYSQLSTADWERLQQQVCVSVPSHTYSTARPTWNDSIPSSLSFCTGFTGQKLCAHPKQVSNASLQVTKPHSICTPVPRRNVLCWYDWCTSPSSSKFSFTTGTTN